MHLLLREFAEKIAGPKGKHEKERTHNHWGSVARAELRRSSNPSVATSPFEVGRFGVRDEAFREEDPLPERVLNQILVGVSTRNYESSLDKPSAKLKSVAASKSAASRHLVSQTKKLEEYLSRRLEEFELAALMMDGLEVAGQTVVGNSRYHNRWNEGAELGYMAGLDGELGVCNRDARTFSSGDCGSTNRSLCVVDEAPQSTRRRGISRLSKDASSTNSEIYARTFPSPVTPTCSRHMKEAYKCKSADKARKRLQVMRCRGSSGGYDEAAGSLREGMEETLTVVKLALPELLRKSLATTNAIENLNGTIRRVSRNVKRWKSPSMIRRCRSRRRHGGEKVSHQRLSAYGRSRSRDLDQQTEISRQR